VTTATDSGTIEAFDVAGVVLEPDALRRIPRTLALRHDILSLWSEGNQLTVAVPDVNDPEAVERVRLVTGMHVRAIRAPRDLIRARLKEAYPPEQPDPKARVQMHRGDEAPAIRALEEIHALAISVGASDVHVEPSRSGGRVRVRVDGILREIRALPGELYAQVVSRVKLLAGMDIADRRQPQDGRYSIEAGRKSIDARVSSVPTILGEKLVLRLLDHQARVPTLDHVGMPQEYRERFCRLIQAPHGFIVVCGPTGSGKTTTLYAAMAQRNVDSQNLCSVEDPVEVRIPGIAQVQVNPRAGVTFASALRAFLRQDPNVIMVGEMRDQETASVAASASLSGQLVLTTLHSNDAPKSIDRLIELGVSRHTIAAGLSALVAQRLVRRLCAHCRFLQPVDDFVAAEFCLPDGTPVYTAGGCTRCSGTGYVGRAALFECVFIDDMMRGLIANGGSSVALAVMARERGYRPMLAHGIRLALAGETSFEELRRVLAVEEAS
jgi:type IV pilus assembly protein PilB